MWGAAALALASCGGDGGGTAGEAVEPAAAASVPLTLPGTTERQVGGPTPTSTATTAAAPATTEPPTGLPDGLGIPGAGNLTLGGGSSISRGLTVRGVPLFEVVAFVERELAALGWAVQPTPPPAPGQVLLLIEGPGAVGQALIAPGVDGAVEVSLFLGSG